MKINTLYTSVMAIALLLACGDEQNYFRGTLDPSAGANIKLLHAASDTARVDIYLDAPKLTGPALGYAESFPSVGYLTVESGSYPFRIMAPAAGALPGKIMVSESLTLENDQDYTVAFAGVTGHYEAVVLKDDVTDIPLDRQAYVRFVNLIHNSTDHVSVLAVSPTGETLELFDDLAYKEATGFVTLPPGNYSNIRLVNTVTGEVLATATSAASALPPNKIFTYMARGQIGSATYKPTFDRMINR